MMSDQYFAGLFDGEGSIGARMHWVRPNGNIHTIGYRSIYL